MTQIIHAVIIDDEPPARKLLRSLLAKHSHVEVVGEAGDVETAAEVCQRLHPNLIFLDVCLPRASGFDLLPLLDPCPAVIFVTAFDRYAVRAFEVNALDYLLKPIDPARLANSLSRISTSLPPGGGELLDEDLVALREDSRIRMVPVKSITHIEAEDNYTRIHLLNAPTAMVRQTLGEWEKRLPGSTFLRLHRSLLVRLDALIDVKFASRDRLQLTFSADRAPVMLGRSAAVRLRRALGKH